MFRSFKPTLLRFPLVATPRHNFCACTISDADVYSGMHYLELSNFSSCGKT